MASTTSIFKMAGVAFPVKMSVRGLAGVKFANTRIAKIQKLLEMGNPRRIADVCDG